MAGRGRRRSGRQRRWRQRGYSRRAVRFLEPTLLLLLHHGPDHGYTLIERLGDYGLDEVDTSAVYRALRGMEEKEWVVSSWEEEETQGPPRRVYHLTELGDEVLRWWTRDLEETQGMIAEILGTYQAHIETGDGDHHRAGLQGPRKHEERDPWEELHGSGTAHQWNEGDDDR